MGKRLYVVTADTRKEGCGTEIELLRVTDNEADRDESLEYARKKGWYATVTEVILNARTRQFLGGYIE